MLGLTVYGCEQDEADALPRAGAAVRGRAHDHQRRRVGGQRHLGAAATDASAWDTSPRSPASMLRALQDAGVEHVSTRSIGVNHIDLRCRRAPRHHGRERGVRTGRRRRLHADADPDGDPQRQGRRRARRTSTTSGCAVSEARDLRDMTVGVVGVGNIGTAVIRRLQGFGCRVLASNNRRTARRRRSFVPLDELLRESDVVTLHLPLNRGDAPSHRSRARSRR